MALFGLWPWNGGLSSELPSADLDILHTLGWTDDAINNMGQALVDDILADYQRGILRKPGITVYPTGETTGAAGVGVGAEITLVEPETAAIDAFLTGTYQDLEDLAVSVADTTRKAGKALTELPGNLVLLIGGAVLLLILLRR